MLSGNSRTQHQKVQRCGVGGTNMNRRCRGYKKVKEVKGVQRCKGGVGGTKMCLGSKICGISSHIVCQMLTKVVKSYLKLSKMSS